jgi:serine protease AprX
MNPAKLHKSLSVTMSADPAQDELVPVILKLRRGTIARGEMRALADIEAGGDFRLLNARATRVTPRMIAALTDDPAVELIWPDMPVHAWLDEAVPGIAAPQVWDAGFTGAGVKVAILDTGLDAAHPDFEGRLSGWRDFVTPSASDADQPRDPNGHGTHVAGIAAGSGAASNGRYRGVAPEAELIIGRVLDAAGGGRTSTVMAAIEWAIDAGAQVINISLGGPPYPADGDDALSLLCNAAVDEGAVVCVAAGNMGPAGHTVGSPGAAHRVITVGASDERNGALRVAPFSSRGPTGDGRSKPDLIFPGVAIAAPRASGTRLGATIGERYTALRGTSQATPMACGTAALLLQANPRLRPDQVKERMLEGARELGGISQVEQGRGLGNAYNTFVGAEGQPSTPTPGSGSEPGSGGGQAQGPGDDGAAQPSGCLPGASVAGALRRG